MTNLQFNVQLNLFVLIDLHPTLKPFTETVPFNLSLIKGLCVPFTVQQEGALNIHQTRLQIPPPPWSVRVTAEVTSDWNQQVTDSNSG